MATAEERIGAGDLSVCILAGGGGRRLEGADKGLLSVGGHALVDHLLASVAPLCDDILISANRNLALYRQRGYPVLEDRDYAHQGPLAGVLRVMRARPRRALWVLSCDIGPVDPRWLSLLLEGLNQPATELALLRAEARLQPLVSLWRGSLQGRLQAYLARGRRSLMGWLEQVRARPLSLPDEVPGPWNINTPEAVQALEQSLSPL